MGATSPCRNSLRRAESRSEALFGDGERGSATAGGWVVRLWDLPGNHYTLLREEVGALAERLEKVLGACLACD